MENAKKGVANFVKRLHRLDIFGSRQGFTSESKKKIKTPVGAVLTLVGWIFFALYIYKKFSMLFNSDNPEINFNKSLAFLYPRMDTFEHNFIISYSLRINNTIIHPSQLSRFLGVKAQKSRTYYSGDQSSPQTGKTETFDLIPRLCALHSKADFLREILVKNPGQRSMILNYSICFDRNVSLANSANVSNLTSVGGGLMNVPLEAFQIAFVSCNLTNNPNCTGFSQFDQVQILLSYPQTQYDLKNAEKPLSYSIGSFKPINLLPNLTQGYVINLETTEVKNRLSTLNADELVDRKSQVSRHYQSLGGLPGIYAVVYLRSERSSIQIYRKYYSLVRLNTDLGSMLESTIIILIIFHYLNGKRAYTKRIEETVRQIADSKTGDLTQVIALMEFEETIMNSRAFSQIILRGLLKKHHLPILRLMVLIRAQRPLEKSKEPPERQVVKVKKLAKVRPYRSKSKGEMFKKQITINNRRFLDLVEPPTNFSKDELISKSKTIKSKGSLVAPEAAPDTDLGLLSDLHR